MKCLGTERMCLLLSRYSCTSHEAHNWLELIPGSVAWSTYICIIAANPPPPPPPHVDRMIVHHKVTSNIMLLLSICTPGWREMVKQNFLTIQMIVQWISFQNKFISSPHISLYLFTLMKFCSCTSHSRISSFWFSIQVKFSFWYLTLFWKHESWKHLWPKLKTAHYM